MSGTKAPHDEQILVVEDHPESAELLQMILENEGYRVQCVETGRDALRVFTENGRKQRRGRVNSQAVRV